MVYFGNKPEGGNPVSITSGFRLKVGEVAASKRITVGCVGVGPQGSAVMGNFLAQKDVRVAAVCDVKSNVREAAQNNVNKYYQDTGCAAYNDFRELIGQRYARLMR